MKDIMKTAVNTVHSLLKLKEENPARYDAIMRHGLLYTSSWDEPETTIWDDTETILLGLSP